MKFAGRNSFPRLPFFARYAGGSAGTVALATACLLAPAAYGQVLTGEIDGTVRDASGAVIPNAVVIVKIRTRTWWSGPQNRTVWGSLRRPC